MISPSPSESPTTDAHAGANKAVASENIAYSTAADITAALTVAARSKRLMLASDFDGCLAPIITKPMAVAAQPEGIDALIELSHLPNTYGAIVSGRDMDRLTPMARRTGPQGQDYTEDRPDQVRDISSLILSGSHGAEANDGSGVKPTEEQLELRNRVVAEAERIGKNYISQGLYIEPKPLGVVMHGAAMEDKELLRRIHEEFASVLDALFIGTSATYEYGKNILEALVLQVNKGNWLENARKRYELDAIVYAGDDTTDEHAFEVLRHPDVSIKIGSTPTKADLRVAEAEDIPAIYQELLRLRREYLAEQAH